jgi:hypothetical protein
MVSVCHHGFTILDGFGEPVLQVKVTEWDTDGVALRISMCDPRAPLNTIELAGFQELSVLANGISNLIDPMEDWVKDLLFTVFYSKEDKEWVAIESTDERYRHLSYLDVSPVDALEGLIDLLEEVIEEEAWHTDCNGVLCVSQ